MADNSSSSGGGLKGMVGQLATDRLKSELKHGFSAASSKAISSAGDRLTGMTEKLNEASENGGVMKQAVTKGVEAKAEGDSPTMGALKGGLSGVKDKVKEKLGGGGSGSPKATKSTNIVESIDVGVPIHVAYNQWTQFQDWTDFMKKVDGIEQQEDEKLSFKAQVFWSHRTWQAQILEQVPDERIIWRSSGDKGRVDGSVTFHDLAPNLTRILVVLEYYPQGLFERTGNLWRAQGRRARLELKHFRRHVMVNTAQNPDEVEGWRGEIHEGEVTRTHDEVVEEEEQRREEEEAEGAEDSEGSEGAEDEYDEEESPEDEYDEEEAPEDEEAEPEDEEAEPEDEYEEEAPEEEEAEPEEEPAEDEYEEEAPEEEEAEPEGESEEPAEEEAEPEGEAEPEDESEEPAEEETEPEEEAAEEEAAEEEAEPEEEEKPKKKAAPRRRRSSTK